MEHSWGKPGDVQLHPNEGLISSHPGEDRDTDSEDEDSGDQKPVPIQDELVDENAEIETATEQSDEPQVEAMETQNNTESVAQVTENEALPEDEQSNDASEGQDSDLQYSVDTGEAMNDE